MCKPFATKRLEQVIRERDEMLSRAPIEEVARLNATTLAFASIEALERSIAQVIHERDEKLAREKRRPILQQFP